MKNVILTILVLAVAMLGTNTLFADDYTDAMAKATKKLDGVKDLSDRTAVQKIRGDFERILQLKKNQWMVNYYMAMCDLLLSWSYMGENTDKDNVKKYTESSLDLLNASTDMKDDFSEAYILKMSATSNRWIYEPEKMNDILAKNAEAQDMAKKLDPNNPRYYLVTGMNTFYTPESFGGGADASMPMFEKSYELYGTFKPVDETYPNWGKDQAAGMIAICYIKKDKLDEAKKWIDKAYEAKPESGFIKNVVMPEYEKAKK
jgi:hypothetical protein